ARAQRQPIAGKRGSAERGPDARQRDCRARIREVLHVDDLALFQAKGLRPPMPAPLLVAPRERHDHAVAMRVDRVEAVVAIAERTPLRDSDLENLTGLVRAVSGER